MRRVFIIGSLMLLLAACGQPDSVPATSSPAVQSAQNNPYPSPALAPTLPTSIPPTVTSTPAVMAPSPTSLPPLTVVLNQSFELQPRQMPNTLVGWSPDGRYFLYMQASSSFYADPSLNAQTGRAWVFDTQTKKSELITDDTVNFSVIADGTTYGGNLPQWTEQCCEIVASFIEDKQQNLRIIDQSGKAIKKIKTVPRSLFSYHNKQINRVDQGKYIKNDKQISNTLISSTGWITSTRLTNDGLYTHNGTDIQYISTETSVWTFQGSETFLKEKPDYRIFRLDPSLDGSWLAVTIEHVGTWERELWIINRDTKDIQLVEVAEKISSPRWSTDTTMLAYKIGTTVSVFDRTTQQRSLINGVFRDAPVWHPSAMQFAVINDEQPQVDVFQVNR